MKIRQGFLWGWIFRPHDCFKNIWLCPEPSISLLLTQMEDFSMEIPKHMLISVSHSRCWSLKRGSWSTAPVLHREQHMSLFTNDSWLWLSSLPQLSWENCRNWQVDCYVGFILSKNFHAERNLIIYSNSKVWGWGHRSTNNWEQKKIIGNVPS